MSKSAIGAAILVAFVAIVAVKQLRSTAPEPGGPATTVSGTAAEQRLAAAKAERQPVVLAFRSNSCRPCVAMGQVLAELRPKYGQRVAIVDVSLDEGTPDLALIRQYKVRIKPTTVLLTKNGDLADEHVGLWPAAELAARLDDLIGR